MLSRSALPAPVRGAGGVSGLSFDGSGLGLALRWRWQRGHRGRDLPRPHRRRGRPGRGRAGAAWPDPRRRFAASFDGQTHLAVWTEPGSAGLELRELRPGPRRRAERAPARRRSAGRSRPRRARRRVGASSASARLERRRRRAAPPLRRRGAVAPAHAERAGPAGHRPLPPRLERPLAACSPGETAPARPRRSADLGAAKRSASTSRSPGWSRPTAGRSAPAAPAQRPERHHARGGRALGRRALPGAARRRGSCADGCAPDSSTPAGQLVRGISRAHRGRAGLLLAASLLAAARSDYFLLYGLRRPWDEGILYLARFSLEGPSSAGAR